MKSAITLRRFALPSGVIPVPSKGLSKPGNYLLRSTRCPGGRSKYGIPAPPVQCATPCGNDSSQRTANAPIMISASTETLAPTSRAVCERAPARWGAPILRVTSDRAA
jgi:hypothetical protein